MKGFEGSSSGQFQVTVFPRFVTSCYVIMNISIA